MALAGKPKLCVICGKPRAALHQYCPRCKRLVGNGKNKRFRRAAPMLAWPCRAGARGEMVKAWERNGERVRKWMNGKLLLDRRYWSG